MMRNHSRQMLAVLTLALGSVSTATAEGMAKDEMAMEKGTTMVGGQAELRRSHDSVAAVGSFM
jgi:hypothetical protein